MIINKKYASAFIRLIKKIIQQVFQKNLSKISDISINLIYQTYISYFLKSIFDWLLKEN